MIDNESRFINDKLMLFRISLKEEKIIIANEDIKKAFINLLAFYLKDMDFSENNSLYLFLNSYASHLNLKDINFLNYRPNINEKELKKYIKKISKIFKIKQKTGNFIIDMIPFFGIKKYRFRLFFLFYLFFIRYLSLMTNAGDIKNNFLIEDIEYLTKSLNLNASEKNLFNDLLNIFNKSYYKDIGENIEMLILNSSYKFLINASSNLLNNIKIVTKYNSLPIYNVGIFATMSAGKSTFVNALLDRDIIPSKNEACTAKITSISDNDNMGIKIFGGCSLDNHKNFVFSNNITNDTLQEWNNNDNVEHIFLETDIKNIHSKNGILVIHDTPGPNNSVKAEHGEITKNFINNNKIDLCIYLINAEHNTTEDNLYFMEYLYNSFKNKKDAKILFLFNKLDSFDLEKEDINTAINNIKIEIEKVGFKSPLIIPISSNAARLFKKVLHKQQLSKKELIDFVYLFRLFNEEIKMDLPSYCSKEILKMSDINYLYKDDFVSDESITVGGISYSREDLIKALDKTSINLVRSILNKEING